MKPISSAKPYEFTKRRFAAKRASAWRRGLIVEIVAAIGAGLGFAWPDHASAFGLMRSAVLGVAVGVVAALLIRELGSTQ